MAHKVVLFLFHLLTEVLDGGYVVERLVRHIPNILSYCGSKSGKIFGEIFWVTPFYELLLSLPKS